MNKILIMVLGLCLILTTNCLAFWPTNLSVPDYETDRLEMYIEYQTGDWGMTPDISYNLTVYPKEGLECEGVAPVRFWLDWWCPEEFLSENRKLSEPYCTPSSNFNGGFIITVWPKVSQSTGWHKFDLETHHYGAQDVKITKVMVFEGEKLQCRPAVDDDEEDCWSRCLQAMDKVYEKYGEEKSTEFYNTDPICQCD